MLPDELGYLWEHFVFLSNRRHYSQAALPITLGDIRTYSEDYGVELTIWDKRVLCRMDDAVVPVINGRMAKAAKGGHREPVQVDASDTATIAQNMRARAKADQIKKEMKERK